MILTGNTLGMSRTAVATAKTKPGVLYAAIGIHPHFAEKEWQAEAHKELEELANLPEVVAIGEIGLDFHRNYSKEDAQITAFQKQVIQAMTAITAVVVCLSLFVLPTVQYCTACKTFLGFVDMSHHPNFSD